jgi:hypothetical protein
MSQQTKLGTHATTVSGAKGVTRVTYHNTEVVTFDDHQIILNSGGWRTSTTKTRMNQASNQFDLGFEVYQTKGEWFVDYKGYTYPFEDNMRFKREVQYV